MAQASERHAGLAQIEVDARVHNVPADRMTPALASGTDLTLVDVARRRDLRQTIDDLVGANLPPFMLWGSPGNWRWHRIYEFYPSGQLAALDRAGNVVAAVNSVPLAWSGRHEVMPGGYDDALFEATERPVLPSASTCLLSISVRASHRGIGVPELLIREMKRRAVADGHCAVIAPLRPTAKSEHPTVALTEYVTWKTPADEPWDPWLRAHVRLGAEILGVAERSTVISDSRARWERATHVAMPTPGEYLVPGALAPVVLDDRGVVTYVEPNVWVAHWIERRLSMSSR